LRQVGYEGRCSIEVYTNDFSADPQRAQHLLARTTSAADLEIRNTVMPNNLKGRNSGIIHAVLITTRGSQSTAMLSLFKKPEGRA
jgi:hypothetical protein